jgi:branched-chain amino acid transport system permease protein
VFSSLSFSPQLVLSQLVVGLVNGSFYAILSLGLAIIFGMLNVINFVQGALFMTGAFVGYFLLQLAGIDYLYALFLTPIIVAGIGFLIERFLLSRIYKIDHIYGWLLTFGLALMIESIFRQFYGVSGRPYPVPTWLRGTIDLGFMMLPIYRAWVILVSSIGCLATWYAIEKTQLGSYLRASTENPQMTRCFGINVPWLICITYCCGVGMAAFAGVLAAPIYQVSPLMGSNIIVVIMAVVVIGGLGSILGTIITGISIGLIEGIAKIIYPEGSHVIIFIIMAIVLIVKPTGLFGKRIR